MAFEPLLVSFRPERILGETPELLVIDKPPGVVVHGGKEAGSDLVSRLRAYLIVRRQSEYLGVHQRLDVGTSGVMVFARRPEANAWLAEAMSSRSLEKRYVALVRLGEEAARLLRGKREVTLSHRLATHDGRSRVVNRGGAQAAARASLVTERGGLALVELRLETGRTHQLRVQLAAIGAPVLGDAVYGDAESARGARRTMLHSRVLGLPDGRRYEAPLPAEFERVLEGRGDELGAPAEQRAALLDAGTLRAPLGAGASAFRLVNDGADGLPGVTVDRYGEFAHLAVASEAAEAAAPALAQLLLEHGARGVYLKRQRRADLRREDHRQLAPESAFAGEPAPPRFVVEEGDMKLWVELGGGLGTGLFVDQRDGRARVRELARGARVLNLFAYTSSFGVAAALGGAARVVSVDLSRRVLAIAEENFRLNGLDPGRFEFVQDDALRWMQRASKGRDRFSLVILDPPSFSSEALGKAFNVRQHYGVAAELAVRLLSPGGALLAITNHRGTPLGRLRATVRGAAERAGRAVAQLKDLPSQLDCPPLPSGPHPSKGVLLRLGPAASRR